MKYFLLYFDILGYEEKARGEAKQTGRPVEDIRHSYTVSLERRLTELKKEGLIVDSKGGSLGDDWLVFTDNMWKTLKTIDFLLAAKLQLAVAIGVNRYEDSKLLVRSDNTIDFLKTRIVQKYAAFHRKVHGHSPHQTFILFTQEVYEELSPTDIGTEPYPGAAFHHINQTAFEKKLQIFDFLNTIGSSRVDYREIEGLYVKPKNANHLTGILEKRNLVFIIGDAEMGKTYTAIRLLLDYFKKGYLPVYYPEEERKSQWSFIREGAEMAKKAIYLEDPWDKVEFKYSEGNCRVIGELIRRAERCDCKVIITSRERVFAEFIARMGTIEDVAACTHHINLRSAYGETERRQILDNYIQVLRPKWRNNYTLCLKARQFTLDRLHTPMSIKQFVDNTLEACSESELHVALETAATETKLCFAREIGEMFRKQSYDRLIFLAFPCFTSHAVPFEMSRKCYCAMVRNLKDMGYSPIQAKEFNALLTEFDKIVEIDTRYNCLHYVHPLYREAYKSVLLQDGKPSDLSRHIFSKIIVELSDIDQFGHRASMLVHNHFDQISHQVREDLIEKIAQKTPSGAAFTIAIRFTHVSAKLQNLLSGLLSDDGTADSVAVAISYGFDGLPPRLRSKFLLDLASRDQAAATIVRCMRWSFLGFPSAVRNKLLPKLAEKNGAISTLAVVLLEYFEHIPKVLRGQLLLALSSKDQAAKNIARAVADYFSQIPEQLRNTLLRRLSKVKCAGYPVARVILDHASDVPASIQTLLRGLPEGTQNHILFLSRQAPLKAIKAISTVCPEIDSNFTLKVLHELSKNQDTETRKAARSLRQSLESTQ